VFSTAALMWAVLNHLVRRWDIDPLRLTLTLALWSPLFLPIYLVAGRAPTLDTPLADLVLQIVYHGWLVALVATFLFFLAVRLAGPHFAATIQTLSPAFAVGLGALLLGERIDRVTFLGAVLTIGGVLLTIAGTRTLSSLRSVLARTVAIFRPQSTELEWPSRPSS
jgi:drug/metabolite transporter (DMT)-like permease